MEYLASEKAYRKHRGNTFLETSTSVAQALLFK